MAKVGNVTSKQRIRDSSTHNGVEASSYSGLVRMYRQEFSTLRWNLVGNYYHQRVLHLLQDLHFITFGQILLTIPLLACMVGGSITILINPSTRLSGNYAFYCLILTFLFAFKTSSIFRLIFGVPWTKLVTLHHLSTVCCLLLTVGHAYVAFTGHGYIEPEECAPGYVAPTEEEVGGGDQRSLVQSADRMWSHPTSQQRRASELCIEENPKYRYSIIGPEPDLWAFVWDGGRNTSGTMMTLCLLGLLSLSSLRCFRQHAFDLWLLLHISLAGAMLAYSNKHRIGTLVWILVLWWGLDGLVRYVWGVFFANAKKATLTKILPDVVEISFPRGNFSFRGGQFVRIAFPKTKHHVMFHPLTLSSAPYEEITTLHFRVVGGWTQYLADLCPEVAERRRQDPEKQIVFNRKAEKQNKNTSIDCSALSPPSSVEISVLIEGPYGSLDMDLWDNHERYPTVVLICGGIGVTPMLSIARQLLYEHGHQHKTRRKVHIVWALRDLSLAKALMPLMSLPQDLKPLILLADSYDDDNDGLVGKNKSCVASATVADSIEDDDLGFEAWYNHDQVGCSSSASVSPISSVFCGDIYLTPSNSKTRKASQGLESGVTADNEETWNLCSNEGFTVHSGSRPDVHEILSDTATESSALATDGNERIAVICCGPASLTKDVKIACVSHSRPGIVMLDFHEEVFIY